MHRKETMSTQPITTVPDFPNLTRSLALNLVLCGITLNEAERAFKKAYIIESLKMHRGNQCRAAKAMGSHRNTLARDCAELDINAASIRRFCTNKREPK
jgi:DNA-binding NtrC family response regulator